MDEGIDIMKGIIESNSSGLSTLRLDLTKRARELAVKYSLGGPPYDPALVAEGLGVKVERDELDGIDGYVEVEGDKYRTVISTKVSWHRYRFTLGHELCHVLLMKAAARNDRPIPLVRYRVNGGPPGLHQDSNEERLCDDFAGELLMPSNEIKLRLAQTEISPQIIFSLANDYDVSTEAAARKVIYIVGSSRSACSLWDLRTLWPMPVWWCGTKTTRSDKNLLESLARQKKDVTVEWTSSKKKSPVHIQAQVMITPGLNYALFFIRHYRRN